MGFVGQHPLLGPAACGRAFWRRIFLEAAHVRRPLRPSGALRFLSSNRRRARKAIQPLLARGLTFHLKAAGDDGATSRRWKLLFTFWPPWPTPTGQKVFLDVALAHARARPCAGRVGRPSPSLPAKRKSRILFWRRLSGLGRRGGRRRLRMPGSCRATKIGRYLARIGWKSWLEAANVWILGREILHEAARCFSCNGSPSH